MSASPLADFRAVQTILGVDPDGENGKTTRAAFEDLGNRALAELHFGGGLADAPASPEQVFTGIADLSHGDSLDIPRLKAAGFAAVIHKASEGANFKDPLYIAREQAARSAGFLWGAYHFASGADGKTQAMNFLDATGMPDATTLYVLDFEPSSHGSNMTLQDARVWLQTVHDATGRWPMVYGGGGLLRDLLEGHTDEVFAKCPLWLCDIRAHPQTILPIWPRWTLLQFWAPDLGGQEPHGVDGSDGADRNSFQGSLEELRAAWPFADEVSRSI